MAELTAPATPRVRPRELVLIGLLAALSATAFGVTVVRMRGMDAGPGTDPGTLGFFAGVWVVMMAAMMVPSAAPVVVVFARLQRLRGATVLFAAGYLFAWAAAGLLAYALARAARDSSIGAFTWQRGGRFVAAGVLVAAAAYQLTPLKQRCLTRCRGPLGFILSSWRDGRPGALRMGVTHGAWCIGCCWALMAALFALGVMSIAWMTAIGLLIAGEKLLPWRTLANRGIATVLCALAVAVAVAPASVPGLTLPTHAAMPSMMR